MGYDKDKIDDAVLALMYLTLHDGARAWKGFEFEVLNRLHRKGLIHEPRNKTKPVVLTGNGLVRSKTLFEEHFGKRS